MKIKTVCDLTGLTDRAIRYYIEEKLISPAYTENYLGRKSFDFSQNDVEELKSISVLRKFDFTIEEIRDIAHDAENSKAVIQNVKARTEHTIAEGQMRQSILSQVEDGRAYSIAELANKLENASKTLPQTNEIAQKSLTKIIRTTIKTTATFLLVWLPVIFQVFFFLVTISYYAYPKFQPQAVRYMILSVLPSLSIIFLGKIKKGQKKAVRTILRILCAVSLFFSVIFFSFLPIGTFAISETTDFVEYRDLDADCIANRYSFYNDLFPPWPHYFETVKGADGHYETVYLDAHYYYRYLSFMDYTYDIYAEWPLEKEAFDKEVARVKALYDNCATEHNRDYVIMEKGSYTCLISYEGNAPFEAVSDSYTYYIFAYDETSMVVRYILCDSLENGADQPYYLALDW